MHYLYREKICHHINNGLHDAHPLILYRGPLMPFLHLTCLQNVCWLLDSGVGGERWGLLDLGFVQASVVVYSSAS